MTVLVLNGCPIGQVMRRADSDDERMEFDAMKKKREDPRSPRQV